MVHLYAALLRSNRFNQTLNQMTIHYFVILASALIPFFVSAVWFNKRVLGGEKWIAASEMPPEKAATPVSMGSILLSLPLNLLLAIGMFQLSVHENGVLGMLGGNAALMLEGTAAAFLEEYGGHYHTWTHGLAHGLVATICFALPVLGYVVLFGKKTKRYFWTCLGFWWINLTLMSIVLSVWGASIG